MEKATIQIGSKFGTEHYSVEVPVELPETWEEVLAIEVPNDVKKACFNRGWRIRLQEVSGAREVVKTLTVEERKPENIAKVAVRLAKVVADYIANPSAKRPGRPAAQQEVVIPSDTMSKREIEKMTALLTAQGLKVTIK